MKNRLTDNTSDEYNIADMKRLSPVRNSSTAQSISQLVDEQLQHFGVDSDSKYGQALAELTTHLYISGHQVQKLWDVTMSVLNELDRSDRIACFNAKRFVCFQLAKLLDNMQNPLRATYQSIATKHGGVSSKGAYPLFDNVTALFSATPVITRTATYLYACTEWVEDAFTGREPLHEIYSRLLNPTSISLANHIVDVECGEYATDYMAWNFNSGMAAIDGLLSHLLGRQDIVLAGRNVYGGTYQLLNDWFARGANLDIAVDWVDGFSEQDYITAMDQAHEKYADRLTDGRQIYIFLESPCNPHGYVLDVPAITRAAHERGWLVICDTTVGTPFLHPTLKRKNENERPDFVIHSYTKDLAGSGTTTAGVVIGRNQRMFIPKHDSCQLTGPDGREQTISWDQTLFWNVYYVKGAFLDSEKAFEVLTGMKTYEMRVLQKAINTITLARLLNIHPAINVHCPILEDNPNVKIMTENMFLGLPAGLFTFDMEGESEQHISLDGFKRFFDNLEPAIGLQVSLGQTNTTALCPALTSHSELSNEALRDAGITPTTVRVSVGLEDPRIIIVHMQKTAELTVDHEIPGFSANFPAADDVDSIYREVYNDVHKRFIASVPDYSVLSV